MDAAIGAGVRSRRMLAVRDGQVFAVDFPIRILAKTAVSAGKKLCRASIPLQLPVEPAHRHGRFTPAIWVHESSAMADIRLATNTGTELMRLKSSMPLA